MNELPLETAQQIPVSRMLARHLLGFDRSVEDKLQHLAATLQQSPAGAEIDDGNFDSGLLGQWPNRPDGSVLSSNPVHFTLHLIALAVALEIYTDPFLWIEHGPVSSPAVLDSRLLHAERVDGDIVLQFQQLDSPARHRLM